jgi:oligopeptide transport system permease protein
MAAVKPIDIPQEDDIVTRSPMGDAWREFRRNKVAVAGMAFIILLLLGALFADFITPYHFSYQNNAETRAKPMTGYIVTTDKLQNCHWADTPIEWACTIFFLGSDSLGRDLWSRMAYGARVSLAVAIVAASVSLVIGTVFGTISGFAGGWVDNLMMRIVDFLYAVPILPVIILMTVYFQSLARAGVTEGFAGALINLNKATGGLLFVFIVLGALSWIGLARLARGQVLSYKQKEFVEAAHAMGASDRRIIFTHLVPNILGPLLIAESMAIPGYIFTEAFLSFIGLGVNPPTPSWGAMVSEGYAGFRSNPHLVLVPGLALAITTLAFNFMGDGLRDAFDPQMRGK